MELPSVQAGAYRECRNQLAQQVADYIGGAVLMVD